MSQIQRFFTVLFFASLLAIAGCSKSGTQAGLEKEDTDGDGIADIYDPDMDGDGIPNGSDPDIDGDGTPNGKDPSPGTSTPNYCDSIQVFGLNEEDTTGSEIVLTWYLQSSKTGGDCVLKEGVKADLIQVTASAAGAADTKSEKTNPLARAATRIQIPHTCDQGAFVEVTYDFTEIADLIDATPNAPGWIVTQRHTADPEKCEVAVNECTAVNISWPDPTAKLGESATVTWSFTPEGCQLADENARLTLTVGDNTDPKFPTESVSAKATDWTATLTLPCATDRKRTLKYEMTGIDEAFGYETGVNWGTTGSHEAATSCPSEPPAPDDKICGVDNLSLFQDAGSYSTLEQQCATYFGAPARRVATLAETQCLCNVGEFSEAKTSFWTSTKDSDGKHWLVDKGSCTAFEVKDPTQSSTAPGLMAACVTD